MNPHPFVKEVESYSRKALHSLSNTPFMGEFNIPSLEALAVGMDNQQFRGDLLAEYGMITPATKERYALPEDAENRTRSFGEKAKHAVNRFFNPAYNYNVGKGVTREIQKDLVHSLAEIYAVEQIPQHEDVKQKAIKQVISNAIYPETKDILIPYVTKSGKIPTVSTNDNEEQRKEETYTALRKETFGLQDILTQGREQFVIDAALYGTAIAVGATAGLTTLALLGGISVAPAGFVGAGASVAYRYLTKGAFGTVAATLGGTTSGRIVNAVGLGAICGLGYVALTYGGKATLEGIANYCKQKNKKGYGSAKLASRLLTPLLLGAGAYETTHAIFADSTTPTANAPAPEIVPQPAANTALEQQVEATSAATTPTPTPTPEATAPVTQPAPNTALEQRVEATAPPQTQPAPEATAPAPSTSHWYNPFSWFGSNTSETATAPATQPAANHLPVHKEFNETEIKRTYLDEGEVTKADMIGPKRNWYEHGASREYVLDVTDSNNKVFEIKDHQTNGQYAYVEGYIKADFDGNGTLDTKLLSGTLLGKVSDLGVDSDGDHVIDLNNLVLHDSAGKAYSINEMSGYQVGLVNAEFNDGHLCLEFTSSESIGDYSKGDYLVEPEEACHGGSGHGDTPGHGSLGVIPSTPFNPLHVYDCGPIGNLDISLLPRTAVPFDFMLHGSGQGMTYAREIFSADGTMNTYVVSSVGPGANCVFDFSVYPSFLGNTDVSSRVYGVDLGTGTQDVLTYSFHGLNVDAVDMFGRPIPGLPPTIDTPAPLPFGVESMVSVAPLHHQVAEPMPDTIPTETEAQPLPFGTDATPAGTERAEPMPNTIPTGTEAQPLPFGTDALSANIQYNPEEILYIDEDALAEFLRTWYIQDIDYKLVA